jgi:hypothetical protein
MATCSMSAGASRCRFHASGVEGAGMAQSSIAAAISFWLARGGVSGSSMLKSVLMRSRPACPAHARVRRVWGFPSGGGAHQSYRVVLLCELCFELARLS